MADLTPMMRQYLEIKEQNKDSILFFRLGDFYEMFNEDAQLASRELDLTLTTRDRGKAAEDQTPMCGIPYHSSDAYIARLIAKGYKVAICEQTEDPALAKGLVKRDIIRVITPGTVIDSACLDDRRGNFLCGIFLDGQNAGAAFCDMTTGHTHVTAFSGDERAEHLYNELSRFSPAEAVLSAGAYDNGELVEYLCDKLSCAVERGENRFELKACEKAIRAQFGEERFASLPRNNPALIAMVMWSPRANRCSWAATTAIWPCATPAGKNALPKKQRRGQSRGNCIQIVIFTKRSRHFCTSFA